MCAGGNHIHVVLKELERNFPKSLHAVRMNQRIWIFLSHAIHDFRQRENLPGLVVYEHHRHQSRIRLHRADHILRRNPMAFRVRTDIGYTPSLLLHVPAGKKNRIVFNCGGNNMTAGLHICPRSALNRQIVAFSPSGSEIDAVCFCSQHLCNLIPGNPQLAIGFRSNAMQ